MALSVFVRMRGLHFLAAMKCKSSTNCRLVTTFSRPLGTTKILRSPAVSQVQVPSHMTPLAAAAAAAESAPLDATVPPTGSFSTLGLNVELQAALMGLNIQNPTEIQVGIMLGKQPVQFLLHLLLAPDIQLSRLAVQVSSCPAEWWGLRPGLTHWIREDLSGEDPGSTRKDATSRYSHPLDHIAHQ